MMRVFYYDFSDPAAYLIAEQMPQAEWVPVRAKTISAAVPSLEGISDQVDAAGHQRFNPPSTFPFDSEPALRAATYAATIGKVVAFSLAAFRQAYAGGRPLDDPDNVVIAAAACEMHPRAVLQAIGRDTITKKLDAATDLAQQRVDSVPIFWDPEQ
jgi:2-hydroxychromene-2-carboxylate isomerase